MVPPRVITITGVSGVGKDTLVDSIENELNRLGIGWARGVTTRAQRPDEIGTYLDFVSHDEFDRLVESEALAEWDEVAGERYGTKRDALQEAGPRGAIKIVTVEGALAIRRMMEDAYGEAGVHRHVPIYISAPESQVLRRLREDRGWTEEKVRARIESIPDGYGPDHTDGSRFWTVEIRNSDDDLESSSKTLFDTIRNFVLCANDWSLDVWTFGRAKMIAHSYGGAFPQLRDEGALKDCLGRHIGVGTEDWTVAQRAVSILRAVIAKHPFVDCNKRIAVMVTEEYLLHSGHRWNDMTAGKVDDVVKMAKDPSNFEFDFGKIVPETTDLSWYAVRPDGEADPDWWDTIITAARVKDVLRGLADYDATCGLNLTC